MQTKTREHHYKSKQINMDPDKRDTKDVNEPLSTLALETVLLEWLIEIIHPRCQVWICMHLGEPSPVRGEMSAVSRTRINSKGTHLLMHVCVGKLSGSHPAFRSSGL